MSTAIDEALTWRIHRLKAEAAQHRQKAELHNHYADDLDMKVIEYRTLLRTISNPGGTK